MEPLNVPKRTLGHVDVCSGCIPEQEKPLAGYSVLCHWFSNVSMYPNQLYWFKHRLPGPTLRYLVPEVSGRAWEIASPGLGTTLREPLFSVDSFCWEICSACDRQQGLRGGGAVADLAVDTKLRENRRSDIASWSPVRDVPSVPVQIISDGGPVSKILTVAISGR